MGIKRYWLLFVGVVLLGSFLAYRAVVIPITHDEASTWLNYRHLNVWSCLSNYSCWGTANNHWLNTLLLQWSAGLFGDSAWAIRLPNVIGGILYLVAASLLSYKYIKSPALQICGFVLLTVHVYLLDFFSLARGYGLMTSGVLWGVYALMRYVEHFNLRWLVWCVALLVLSVLANFIALLPWTVLGVSWLVWLVLHKKQDLLLRHGLVWLISLVILWFLLSYPIKVLTGSGEFAWGSLGLWPMMIDLIGNLLYGLQYFGEQSILILLWCLVGLVCIVAGALVVSKKTSTANPVFLALILLVVNFVVLFLQQKITGAYLPVGRKTIYLIPFIFLLISLSLNLIQHKIIGLVVGSLLSIGLLYHARQIYPWTVCREWYYDAYYPELFRVLLPEGPASDSVRLGSSWIFNPAFTYYQKTKGLPLSGLAYQKPLQIDSTMQYYYVESPDTIGMYSSGFVLEKNIGLFFLYKKNARSPLINTN